LVESIHDEINNNTNGRTQSVDLQNYKIRKYYSMNDDLSSFDTEYLVVNLNESSENLKKIIALNVAGSDLEMEDHEQQLDLVENKDKEKEINTDNVVVSDEEKVNNNKYTITLCNGNVLNFVKLSPEKMDNNEFKIYMKKR